MAIQNHGAVGRIDRERSSHDRVALQVRNEIQQAFPKTLGIAINRMVFVRCRHLSSLALRWVDEIKVGFGVFLRFLTHVL